MSIQKFVLAIPRIFYCTIFVMLLLTSGCSKTLIITSNTGIPSTNYNTSVIGSTPTMAPSSTTDSIVSTAIYSIPVAPTTSIMPTTATASTAITSPPLTTSMAPQTTPVTPQPTIPNGSGISSNLIVISSIRGTVQVMKVNANTWLKGEIGTLLAKEDSLKTEAASSAEVTLFDGSTIEIQENTEIKIIELGSNQTKGTTTILRQEIGQTISFIKKLVDSESRYEIKTPAGVAAVRGTTLQVSVASDGSTLVANIEGTVTATAQGKEGAIPVGYHSFIFPGLIPSPPRPGLNTTTFDFQRAAVVIYLKDWSRTDWPVSQILGSITMPGELNANTLSEITNNVNSALAALQTNFPKVGLLTAPDIYQVKTHLQIYSQIMDAQLANILAMQKAVTDNSPPAYVQAMVELNNIVIRVDDFNLLTTKIMSEYDILESDALD
jgi:hypothetical protein